MSPKKMEENFGIIKFKKQIFLQNLDAYLGYFL